VEEATKNTHIQVTRTGLSFALILFRTEAELTWLLLSGFYSVEVINLRPTKGDLVRGDKESLKSIRLNF
jgi:hypothetical protein